MQSRCIGDQVLGHKPIDEIQRNSDSKITLAAPDGKTLPLIRRTGLAPPVAVFLPQAAIILE
jgi:hypothetical protein